MHYADDFIDIYIEMKGLDVIRNSKTMENLLLIYSGPNKLDGIRPMTSSRSIRRHNRPDVALLKEEL